jgi:phosphatidate cytidylyltransferase
MPDNKIVFLLLGVFSILTTATVVIVYLTYRKVNINHQELIARIKTWWVIIVLISVCAFIGNIALIVMTALISFLALKEYLALVSSPLTEQPGKALIYTTIPIQYYFISTKSAVLFMSFIPVCLLFLIPLRFILLDKAAGALAAITNLHWGLMTTVYSLSHMAVLLVLPGQTQQAEGIILLLFFLALTQFNDVSQYLWGNLLGKRKLIPEISPNKTRAGLVGGMLTTTVLCMMIGPWLTPLNSVESIGTGLILSLAGFIGDATLSAIKRDLNTKDTGDLLPGHGGVLDRIDSLIFSAPLFVYYLYFLHYQAAT